MYIPAVMKEKENPEVNPFGKQNTGDSASTAADVSSNDAAILEWIRQHGKGPTCAIGLQAFQISWDDETCRYNAGSPWWR